MRLTFLDDDQAAALGLPTDGLEVRPIPFYPDDLPMLTRDPFEWKTEELRLATKTAGLTLRAQELRRNP